MRHLRKPQRKPLTRVLIASLLVVLVSIGSVVTVMANTVDITVRDGEDAYTFSMLGTDAEEILARAETEGMAPISDIDTYEFSEADGILTVWRAVRVSVEADGASHTFIAAKNTLLADVLAENGIVLGVRDTVEPAVDTQLTADTRVVVTRSSRVFVEADGMRRMLDLLGGTVADALQAAGIVLGERDSVSPAEDTPLSNGMRIYVARYIDVTVTADGETGTYSVAAHSYGDAVEKAGIVLGGQDRLCVETADGETTVKADDPVSDGDSIRVIRIRTEEVTETEAIAYETTYKDSDELYEDETEVLTKGEEGEKRVTYTVTYADGEEESREPSKEEIIREPKDAVVRRGTKQRAAGASGSAGTFTDASGKQVAYAYSLTGSCTAYYAPEGAITSIGAKPQVGYVAVNPNIIPYGSLLYITSPYGTWNYGYCYAMDTGGAAMAGDIVADLYYDTYEECCAFGRRDMTVYVIRAGWE
ncbi:MAG: G5 domain-containing protein [Hominenteromicrobium sp.]